MSLDLTQGTVESPLVKWLGLVVALIVVGVGTGFGIQQALPTQEIILFAVATFVLVAWAWRFYAAGRRSGRPRRLRR